METILGVIVGFVAFGVIWFFLLRQKNNQIPTDELKLKEEELKRSEIDLATRVAEIKAAEDAKKDLAKQLDDKKLEVTNLYNKVDDIVKGVGEYKSISEKAINKHDQAITRHTNWWEKLTTNITYQGKFNQEILENLLTSAINLKNDKSYYSTIIKLLNNKKKLESNYSLKEIICVFHIIEYSLTIFVQRIRNNSIKWFNNKNDKSIKQILSNLSDTKNIVINEKNLLIHKL